MLIVSRNIAMGDVCMAALAVACLNDCGHPAVLKTTNPIAPLLNVPMFDNDRGQNVQFVYESGMKQPENFVTRWLSKHSAALTRRSVPVTWLDVDTPVYDVAMNTKTSHFGKYRSWPHWADLKSMLDTKNVSWIDLDQAKVRDGKCLSIVKRCKVYVGLETGTSHLVSSVAAGKGIIIQSGFTLPMQWAVYDYQFVEHRQTCGPCYLTSGCQYDHACMAGLPATTVFDEILSRLSGRRTLGLAFPS